MIRSSSRPRSKQKARPNGSAPPSGSRLRFSPMVRPFTPKTPGCAEPPGELRGARQTAAGSMPMAERQAGKR
eukprot:11244465-Heterocapsa_arctica.AAC.1